MIAPPPSLADFTASECRCPDCVAMCLRKPCWPTPREAAALIRAGYGAKLMLDYWEDDDELAYTEVVCPAVVGREGKPSHLFGTGQCTMLEDGCCTVHLLKPSEGRLASHAKTNDGQALHLAAARTWATASGRRLVKLWRRRYQKQKGCQP